MHQALNVRRQLRVAAKWLLYFLTTSAIGCTRDADDTGARVRGGARNPSAADGSADRDAAYGEPPALAFDAGTAGAASGTGIPQTCAQSLEQQSYIGCEYWPVVTTNASLAPVFSYAIAIANPTGSEAKVSVTRAGKEFAREDVAGGALKLIKLPWVAELKRGNVARETAALAHASVLLAQGAYHVTSSVPITLYQFNPLEFQFEPAIEGCQRFPCYSHTNDASLMFPTTALRTEYYVLAHSTSHAGLKLNDDVGFSDAPAFVAITATEPNTEIDFKTSAFVREGASVHAMAPGETQHFVLAAAGDVVQLETADVPSDQRDQAGRPCTERASGGATKYFMCPAPDGYDLSGSHILANAPISVVAGHDCANIPYGNMACDHLEESVLPVEALGNDLIVTAPVTFTAAAGGDRATDSMVVRVLSAVDGNRLEFDPKVAEPVLLNAGHWIELGPINRDFRIKAQDKILATQYMVGQEFSGRSVEGGDPSLSIAIPTAQYRLHYTFLAPETYTYNLVNVVAPVGSAVRLDRTLIPAQEFEPIGESGMAIARRTIAGGVHSMSSEQNFGIVVYGYGSYTSYMYPGGLNLETIKITPPK